MALTEIACRKAKPGPKPVKMADSQGLYLLIKPTGGKYWRWKYRYLGKEKLMAFGVYPEITLAEAREKLAQGRKVLANGNDPSQLKQDNKRLRVLNAENTFESIAREWHQHQIERWSAKHAKDILTRLEMDIFPIIGKRPIRDLQPPLLLKMAQTIESRGANEMAKRSLQYVGQIFRYAIVNGLVDRNPVSDLRGALKPYKRGHYTAMEAKDLPEFMAKLERNEARLFPQTRLAVELLLLTFVRTNELINAKWAEINFKEKMWIVPAERMKMRKSHMVPLSKRSLEILQELKILNGNREFVFPSQHNPRKAMSNNAILKALHSMGYKGKTTGHGFRALAMSTIKEKLGYRHEVIDRQLAHAHKSEVDAAYDRALFINDRTKMMQEWAEFVGNT